MEFGTREILILLGVVVIFGILLDGFRRVRRSHSGSLKVSRKKHAIFDDEDIHDLPSELPTGQVRVTRRDEQSVEEVSDNIRRYRERYSDRQTSAFRERSGHGDGEEIDAWRDEAEIHPEEPVPENRQEPTFEPAAEEQEPDGLPETGDRGSRVSLDEFAIDEPDEPEPAEPHPGEEPDDGRREPVFAVREDEQPPPTAEQPFRVDAEDEGRPGRRRPFWEEKSATPAPDSGTKTGGAGEKPDLSDVIVLHVMARKEGVFPGKQLLEAILANHMRFGSMQIFHRHENKDGSGPVLFSLANSLNPGTFDIAAMEEFETPGVTLFMALENLANPLDSFNELVKTAQHMAKSLDGILQDETRSVLTKQTIEHQRQQIIEFTRRSFTLTN